MMTGKNVQVKYDITGVANYISVLLLTPLLGFFEIVIFALRETSSTVSHDC